MNTLKRWACQADRIDFDDSSRTFSAIATTPAVDMDDEVVVPEGADVSYIAKNRSIFFNHNLNMPIGSIRNPPTLVRHGDGKAWRVAASLGKTALANDVWSLMRDGHINGVSIGFDKTEWGPPTAEEVVKYGKHRSIVRRWKWMELSVTPIPANPDATIAIDAEEKAVKGLARDGRIRQETADQWVAAIRAARPRPTPKRLSILLD